MKSPGHGGFAEWLSDNYHLLIREGEAVYAELRHAREQPLHKGKPAVYTLFAEWLELRGMPEEAELGELLQEAEKQRPLTVFELTQLPLCMRAALLQTAAGACTAPAEEAEEKMALAVTGLRQMADFDFSALTERYSIVERILQKDPAGVYPRMDESSREMYRQLVAREAIAQGKSETAVAADVIEAAEQGDTVRTRHVGEILLHLGDHKRLARGRALMTASLCKGDFSHLRVAVQDRLHQPYRFPMIPGAEQVFYIAYGLGAHAVAISGAGPSILAVIDSADTAFADKAALRLREAGLTGWQVQLFGCDSRGATVEFVG